MRIRARLRTPWGDDLVRDAVEGHWEEPSGNPEVEIGEGLWSLPGLIDGHAHFAAAVGREWKSDTFEDTARRALEAVNAGVVMAFDKGWANLHTIRLIETVEAHRRPEIEAAGIINAVQGGYWPDFARELTAETFEQGIAASIAEGKGWVKLIGDWPRKGQGPVANFDEGQLRKAVEMADTAGSRVAIHTMAREAPAMAVRAGVHSIEHGLFLEESDLDALGSRGGIWVPTILRMEAVRDQLGSESSGGKLLTEGLENVAKLMPLAAEAGVQLLAGTDVAIGIGHVAREALRMVEYGLDRMSALRAVSVNGLAVAGHRAGFAIGDPADVVMFDSDPLQEIEVLGSPTQVMRLGRLLG